MVETGIAELHPPPSVTCAQTHAQVVHLYLVRNLSKKDACVMAKKEKSERPADDVLSTDVVKDGERTLARLPKGLVLHCLEEAGVYYGDVGIHPEDDRATVEIALNEMPLAVLSDLNARSGIAKNVRKAIADLIKEADDADIDPDKLVSDIWTLGRLVSNITEKKTLSFASTIAKRQYEIEVRGAQTRRSWFGLEFTCTVSYKVCEVGVEDRISIYPEDFEGGKTLRELLATRGLSIFTPEQQEQHLARKSRAMKLSKMCGLLVDVGSNVLVKSKWLFRTSLSEVTLGSAKRQKQLIIDPEMEVSPGDFDCDREDDKGDSGTLPFVRAFSLDLKEYVYADVDDVRVHEFETSAHDRLVLPKKMKDVLLRVFDSESSMSDMFSGRHGGMVIMANGPSGVGKTLTAEVFAEHTKRPLYTLEMGELGTDLQQVEASLQLIFARAARWNAVLLFDEADIFLSKRSESDLERSAIVGVFLRLLDRYEGTFFLTTNRGEVIDPAFKSRITLFLEYPALDATARAAVWRNMLKHAGFTDFKGDLKLVDDIHLVNGRQIRNIARLLRAQHGPDVCKLTVADIVDVMPFVAR